MKQLPQREQSNTQRFVEERNGASPPIAKPKRFPKWAVYTGIAIATLIAVMWAFRPIPIRVETSQVTRGTLQVTVNAEGKTRIHDRYIVGAPVNGHLARITLTEGDTVQAGAIVAQIDPLPLNASVQQAVSQLAEWRAQREGVATQRPKTASLAQAQSRIRAAVDTQRQAQAKVEQAQAALNQAQRDRQRAQQLQASGALSHRDRESAELTEITRAKEFDAAQLAAKAAASEVDVAQAALSVLQAEQSDPDYLLKVYNSRIASVEAELSKLKQDAARTEIRSPVAGKVLRIQQKSAQFVTEGTPLLEIGDVSKQEVVIDVLSSDATRIKPGNPILIDVLMDQVAHREPLRATVRLVEPSAFTKISALGVEEQRVNVIGDFVEPSSSLGDAYRVETRIVVWQGNNVLKVPLSALFRCDSSVPQSQQKWCVFTVQANRATRRPVDIGQRSDLDAELLRGLTVNDTVILHPTEQIQPGTLVSTS
jgi:HlyD family secretion protein